MPSSTDPLDSLFSLEEQYYAEGHALGVADGSKAGLVEGRLFGLQKGFEKFAAMGALAGQCAVWEARALKGKAESGVNGPVAAEKGQVAPSPYSARLHKHIVTLAGLTEAASLDTRNKDEAVADFDDRLKRGEAKAKVIARVIGEKQTTGQPSRKQSSTGRDGDDNMEDFTLPKSIQR